MLTAQMGRGMLPPMNPYEMLLAKVEKVLGAQDAQALKRIFDKDELRSLLVALPPAISVDDGVKAALMLAAILGGKESHDQLPRALSVFLVALQFALKTDPDLTELKVKRPTERGLPEMAEQLAEVKEAPTTNLPMITSSPAELRAKAARVRLLRKLTRRLGMCAANFHINLVTEERALFEEAKPQYERARPYVQSNATLREQLEDTEAYFYEAAKQGAETTKIRKAEDEKREEKATLQATAKADEAASARMADRLRALVERLEGKDQEDEPPPSSKTSRKTPR